MLFQTLAQRHSGPVEDHSRQVSSGLRSITVCTMSVGKGYVPAPLDKDPLLASRVGSATVIGTPQEPSVETIGRGSEHFGATCMRPIAATGAKGPIFYRTGISAASRAMVAVSIGLPVIKRVPLR